MIALEKNKNKRMQSEMECGLFHFFYECFLFRDIFMTINAAISGACALLRFFMRLASGLVMKKRIVEEVVPFFL